MPIDDSQQFFNNISLAGFITCTPCQTKQTTTSNPTAAFSPTNQNGQPIGFAYPSSVPNTNALGALYWSSAVNEGPKAIVTTGGMIESKALAELDRKIDDGSPATGQFRYSNTVPSTSGTISNTPLANCLAANAAGADIWKVAPTGQCQGALLL